MSLRRIVIDKDQAFRKKCKFICDIRKIPVFRFPVCLDLDKIIFRQFRIRMFQTGDRIFIIVLGINIQNDA